jgi:phosphopantothenoylcysteine decarboxylase/phosphopantothenate--cysteine ligase
MSHLYHKNIVLGITGSIAAYKAMELIRLLRSEEAHVNVVMTHDATQFIPELTVQAIASNAVYKDLFDLQREGTMSHIALAKWADVLLIAPATANVMGKFCSGLADDLLSTLYLATAAKTILVPAMNQQMWQHPATVANREKLVEQGVKFLGPDFGVQACGDVGPGRMVAPEVIVNHLEAFFAPKLLSELQLLITAGPTREPIDPVRFISNYSSGKMGYALAEAATQLGAKVSLISGPTCLKPPLGVQKIAVETAEEMHQAVMESIPGCHIFIATAAVADYRPASVWSQKIKKSFIPTLQFEENVDILSAVSCQSPVPFLVGFAAESEHLIPHAKEKLRRKKLNMIVANQIGSTHSGFNSDYNAVSVLTPCSQVDLPLMPKKQLAYKILQLVYEHYSLQKA